MAMGSFYCRVAWGASKQACSVRETPGGPRVGVPTTPTQAGPTQARPRRGDRAVFFGLYLLIKYLLMTNKYLLIKQDQIFVDQIFVDDQQ
jgi:hypothetical protein